MAFDFFGFGIHLEAVLRWKFLRVAGVLCGVVLGICDELICRQAVFVGLWTDYV